MAGFFAEYRNELSLVQQDTEPNRGFRLGQLGALHAVLAHATVHDEPAIVCLPTGYGKTSLMMALPFLTAAQRVLIVEPSDALRRQVASHLQELSTLRRIGAVSADLPNPVVERLEGRPTDAAAWERLVEKDVVVTTPGSASPVLAPGAQEDLFDLIVFDEAHHAPADTWAAFLAHYKNARFVFLTATPFRRDGRVIPGKLVYRYPVTRAVEEGAFRPVAFRAAPVHDPLNDAEIDRSIAETAVAQLQADIQHGMDHRLFVRASSIKAARELVPLYRELGVAVEAIDSKVGKRRQDECERKLVSGELQGIVCVDMFGEGYDFPKLKVAALHAPHRSLVPTIQFIGRFARSDETTGDATLIAPLSRIADAPNALLKEGVDLALMIDRAAQAELEGNVEEQAVIERFSVRKVAESDYDAVSPLALQLYAHVRIFRCFEAPDFTKIGDTVGKALRAVKQWLTEDGTVSLVLTVDESPPNWATSDVLMNVRHDAFLLMYFPEGGLCYVGATRRTEKIYQSLIDEVCEGSRPLSYEETSRARAGLEEVRFFNVGLKNTTFNSQGETYRTLTGPAAERAVTAGDSRAYAQGHFFGSGTIDNEKETIGASSSSRIWSNQNLSVARFMDWVTVLNRRIVGDAPFSQTQLDMVRAATQLREIPAVVIAGSWSKTGFKTNPRIRYIKADGEGFYKRLTDWELSEFVSMPVSGCLDFKVIHDQEVIPMRFSIRNGAMVSLLDDTITVLVESAIDDWMPLTEWLREHPPVFYSADKSSFEGMNLMAAPQVQAATLAAGDAYCIDWAGCAIRIEFVSNDGTEESEQKRAALAGQTTVQEHLEQHLCEVDGLVALFYDHRSGEAADYIAVTVAPDGEVDIALYHCKGAGGAPSGGRVGDVYEVAGQLVKSVYYCEIVTLLAHMEDRMHSRHRYPSSFIVGDLDSLRQLLQDTVATKRGFTVVGVQPGISRNAVDEHLADLMVFGIEYAKRGGAARAYWLVSE
ncbi:DEAD/DEAH box helicase family protein [Alcaligenes aquatilis]|uniref:DEAD/DEAH box helicase n=1 Tax=Alcaligenes aquatilis TaxID=323284 RepID=UPI000F659E13|nr:DEAD/DEAH box helicase family protein [Alcaligenes aquatilis]QXR34678.1 DEAD/DEAH box helicase family protein [Alcaligenes aquatilis]